MILHSLSSFTNFIGKIPETQRNTKITKKEIWSDNAKRKMSRIFTRNTSLDHYLRIKEMVSWVKQLKFLFSPANILKKE
jgi:hypothetical protein